MKSIVEKAKKTDKLFWAMFFFPLALIVGARLMYLVYFQLMRFVFPCEVRNGYGGEVYQYCQGAETFSFFAVLLTFVMVIVYIMYKQSGNAPW